jgi:hypothetical protein
MGACQTQVCRHPEHATEFMDPGSLSSAFASRWSIEMTKTEYALTSDHFSRNTVRILAVSGSIR